MINPGMGAVNPDQQMVDNATSAIASKNANMRGRWNPGDKQRAKSREMAISRRLARGKK